MGKITMSMDGYDMELPGSAPETYGDEVMYAGWNPALEQSALAQPQPADMVMPPDVAAQHVGQFIARMALRRKV